MNVFRQILSVTWLNLRTVPQRLASSIVGVVGIAGVVLVLVAVLSIAEGFTMVMRNAGSPHRAVIMRSGADSEMTSTLMGPEVDVIKQAPGLRRNGQTVDATAELFVIIDLPKKSTGTGANVPLRGIEPTALAVRDEASIVDGRMLQFGTNEVVVGLGASRQFSGLTVGSEIRSGQVVWNVVGVFESDGSVAETEIWCDAKVLQGAYRRGNSYQSLLATLDTPESFGTLKNWLTANPQVAVNVRRENDYYAAQSQTLSTLIRTIDGRACRSSHASGVSPVMQIDVSLLFGSSRSSAFQPLSSARASRLKLVKPPRSVALCQSIVPCRSAFTSRL